VLPGKSAVFARDQLAGWERVISAEVQAGRRLCRRFHDEDTPEDTRRDLFAAAQSFQAPLAVVVSLLEQGYELTIEHGRACLWAADGLSMKLGDPI